MAKKAGSEDDVRWEDQANINSFSKLNSRLKDIVAELTVRNDDLQKVEEANDELALVDGNVKMLIGEAFVSLDQESAVAQLEKMADEVKATIEKLNKEKESIEGSMTSLKDVLKSKFGDSINLEDDVEE